MLDAGRKVSNTAGASKSTPSKVTSRKGQKVTTRNETAGTSKETTELKKSHSGQTIKPTEKAQDQNLIVELVELLGRDWEVNWEERANAFLTNIECEDDDQNSDENTYRILASRLIQANVRSKKDYALAT